MERTTAITLGLTIIGWILIGLGIGTLTDMLVARHVAVRDSTDRPFSVIVATIGSLIGGTVGWSLRADSGRDVLSLGGALLGALVLALVFRVATPI